MSQNFLKGRKKLHKFFKKQSCFWIIVLFFTYFCMLLCSNVCFYTNWHNLCTFACFCVLLHLFVNFGMLMHTFACFCTLLHAFAHFGMLFYTSACFCALWTLMCALVHFWVVLYTYEWLCAFFVCYCAVLFTFVK